MALDQVNPVKILKIKTFWNASTGGRNLNQGRQFAPPEGQWTKLRPCMRESPIGKVATGATRDGGRKPTLIWNDLCQHARRRNCGGRSPGAERDRRSGSLRRWVNLIFVGYIRCQLQCHILIFRLERPQSTIASPEGGTFLAPRVVAGSPDRAHCRLPLSIPGLRGRTRPQVRQFSVSLPPGSERPR